MTLPGGDNSITDLELSVILPCRNEEQVLAYCLNRARNVLIRENISGELIVSDSSTDNSPAIARQFGARLIKHDRVGYGRAYLEGFRVARGRYIFMADADGSYDFNEIPRFLAELKNGYDLVIGNRFRGQITPGAMPWTHRHLGNPLLSALLRQFFKVKVGDAHCGLRAISQAALSQLNLKTTGMEFASEMIMAAGQKNLKIKELSIDYCQRQGESKLKPLSDGWRHLRFMLMYAPNYLFLAPGAAAVIGGSGLIIFFYQLTAYGCFLILLGYQLISLGVYTKTYLQATELIAGNRVVNVIARFIKLESGVAIGALIVLAAAAMVAEPVFNRVAIILNIPPYGVVLLALTIATIGVQTIFSAFFISMLLVGKK